MYKGICFLLISSVYIFSCAPKIGSTTKQTGEKKAPIENLPESQLDIPIQINLRPIFALAEKSVDTVFTSPNYPADWVQEGCATRYKYYFKRSPLKLAMTGSQMNLSFVGSYKIVGSTRVCKGNTVLSPWTPDCRCGFSEGDRKVNIGFNTSFLLQSNHILALRINRAEPKPLNKCTVCFWGQDITDVVMDGLKAELDLSKKAIEDSFGTMNIRPYLQQAWNSLSQVYAIPNLGYFSLQPKKLSMENITGTNDLLNINFGITATPQVSFVKKDNVISNVPNLTPSNARNSFNINLEAALQYDSLSNVINGYMANKRFDLSEGIIKKHVIIKNSKIYSDGNDNMVVEVEFGGSHNGTVYFTGKPMYNPETKKIEMQDLDYDLKTRDFLLKAATWLFDKRIVSEIKKYTSIDLSGYYTTAQTTMNSWLNKEWTKGIKGSGTVKDLKLTAVYALPQHLLIRSNCTGNLSVTVNEIDLKLL